MPDDETIKAEMIAALKRRRRICPKTIPAYELVETISPAFPGTGIAWLAVAVFRISGRKPFKRRLVDEDIVICLKREET